MIKERDLELRFVHGRPEEGEKRGHFLHSGIWEYFTQCTFHLGFYKKWL